MTDPAGLLTDALEATATAERQRALRALLRRPLLSVHGDGAEALALVRRHARELRAWLAEQAGWTLEVGPEVARLRKVGLARDATRPARVGGAPGGRAFSRRQYVLLCLALAGLERGEDQTTLGRLADDVLGDAADPRLRAAGIAFSMASVDQRRDLVAVVRTLLAAGALRRVAGEEQAFVDARGDALYDVDRRVLAAFLGARRGPSTIDAAELDGRVEAATAELVVDTDESRTRALRQRLTRRLLDDPVLYLDELDAAELAYLTLQRTRLLERIEEATGLVAEVRAEGIALLDPTGEATDLGLPETGTDGHVTLLVAEHLAFAGPTPLPALAAHVEALAAAHASYWRADTRDPGAGEALAEAAVARLEGLRLVVRRGEVVVPRPALARYAVAEPTVAGPRQEALGQEALGQEALA